MKSESMRALCGNYFKAGDAKYEITISPIRGDGENALRVWVSKKEKESAGAVIAREFEIGADEGSREYKVYDLGSYEEGEERESFWFDVSEASSGKLSLTRADSAQEHGEEAGTASEECGAYYSCDLLFMSESLERPLNQADILGMSGEELRLLRNQFFAIYGRIFEDEKLKAYFSSQPWYIPAAEASAFDGSAFTDMEKRNIDFLKNAEAGFSEERAEEERAALAALPDAPYRELLPEQGEMYVEIYSDAQNAEDRGIYYAANGKICLPVTVTPSAYREVMEKNGQAEVCVDELTGTKMTMRKNDNPKRGDCVLYDAGDSTDTGYPYFFSYDANSGNYFLWRDSADTLFKPVYSGEIYVMKGAEEEYTGNFSISLEEHREGSGWRRMDFDEENAVVTSAYSGNAPVFDEKGYLRALYYYGD